MIAGTWRARHVVTLVTPTVAVLLVSVTAGATGFTSGVVNAASSLAAGTLVLQGTAQGAPACRSSSGTVTATNAATCTGPTLGTAALSTTGLHATVGLSQVGTTAATAGSISLRSCGLGQVAATAGSGDTGLVYNAVTYGQPGPRTTGATAVTLTAARSSSIDTVKTYVAPRTFTEIAWFETTAASGIVMSFTDRQAASAAPTTGGADRAIWMLTGRLYFGVEKGRRSRQHVLAGPSTTYDNGQWTMVAASVGSGGMTLWVDGASVGKASVTSADPYSGWWHLGFGEVTATWPHAPSSQYWDGSLARMAVVPSQLSTASLQQLYTAPTESAYVADVAALGPTASWTLDDAGDVPYTTPVPGLVRGGTTAYVDASGHADTASVHGAVSATPTGPLGGTAVGLTGATGTYLSTAASYADPAATSEIAWFKAPTSGFGGSIIGFTNEQGATTPSMWDRMVWMDPSGHLVYGVYPTRFSEVTSGSRTYADGRWHVVVASYGAAGQQLWVDGVEVGSSATTTSAQAYTGWWHIGYSNATVAWADPPSSPYWVGTLGQVAVVPGQLSPGQVAALGAATTATAYGDMVGALGPSAYWPLTATAVQADSGLCDTIELTVQSTVGSTTTCAYPAGPGACPPPGAASPASGFAAAAVTPASLSATETVRITMRLAATAPAGTAGLHVVTAFAFEGSESAWSETLRYPDVVVWY